MVNPFVAFLVGVVFEPLQGRIILRFDHTLGKLNFGFCGLYCCGGFRFNRCDNRFHHFRSGRFGFTR